MEELKALKSTASGKASGLDGITSDILKNDGKEICEALLDLFNISELCPKTFVML